MEPKSAPHTPPTLGKRFFSFLQYKGGLNDQISVIYISWGRRGHDRVVIGLIATYAIGAYHHQRCQFESCSGEVYSIQYYVIKFVRDLRQVHGFLHQ